jgi:hypothetical protein
VQGLNRELDQRRLASEALLQKVFSIYFNKIMASPKTLWRSNGMIEMTKDREAREAEWRRFV